MSNPDIWGCLEHSVEPEKDLGFPGGSVGKESTFNAGFNPWVGKIPWRREWLPTLVFWPGESHGLYSLRGCKEWDMTE